MRKDSRFAIVTDHLDIDALLAEINGSTTRIQDRQRRHAPAARPDHAVADGGMIASTHQRRPAP